MNVLKYPLSTEKSIKLIGTENKIVFIVDNDATKTQIKEKFESLFKVKIIKVNTLIDKGRKKAYIKLASENPATDVATQLGLM